MQTKQKTEEDIALTYEYIQVPVESRAVSLTFYNRG